MSDHDHDPAAAAGDPYPVLSRLWADLVSTLNACGRVQPARARGAAAWMAERLTRWGPGRADEPRSDWRQLSSPYAPPDPRRAARARAGAALVRAALAARHAPDHDTAVAVDGEAR